MKSIINFPIAIALLVTAISCSDQKTTERILSDPERLDAILTAIANDSSLHTRLHQKMHEDNKASMDVGSSRMRSCMAMMENPEMMNMMMDHMMTMGENDSTKGKMICDKMMRSSGMKNMMKDMMDKEKM